MIIVKLLFYIYWILKPFYLFPSGGMQIGDLVLMLAVILLFVMNGLQGRQGVLQIDMKLLMFVIFVFVINLIYHIFSSFNYEFMRSSSYYLFNFLLVILFRELARDKVFIRNFFFICRINMCAQTGLYLIHQYGGGSMLGRYLGTFNNPNQLALFAFGTFLIMNIIASSRESLFRIRIIDYVNLLMVLVMSASRGMLLGIATFFLVSLLVRPMKIRVRIMCVALLVGFVFMMLNINPNELLLFERFRRTFASYTTIDVYNSSFNIRIMLEEREIDRIFHYPQYMLFGSGEGGIERFVKTARTNGIHSTFVGLLFHYGIVPFLIFLSWIKANLRGSSKNVFPMLMGFFFHSFFIMAQRQPYFWIMLVLIHSLYDHAGLTATALEEKDSPFRWPFTHGATSMVNQDIKEA